MPTTACAPGAVSPEGRGAPHEDWQHRTDFASLHKQFPNLVDVEGCGWFSRHFHRAMQFALARPDLVHKNYAVSAGKLDKLFDREWRSKVLQYQTESLSTLTEGAWTIRFDDMIADALELGPCAARSRSCRRNWRNGLSRSALRNCLPMSCPLWSPTIWLTGRRTATGWCSPVTNFDCYFGDTNFGRKYLNQLPRRSSSEATVSASAATGSGRNICQNKRRDWPVRPVPYSLFMRRILCAACVLCLPYGSVS